MADTKITALAAIGANPINVATFPIPMVDLLDNSMAASGTTKKVTVNQILGAGGTATLASATITGDLTVDTSTLKVDSANNRVGVLTASPAYDLDVNGVANFKNAVVHLAGGNPIFARVGAADSFFYAGTTALTVRNNADTQSIFSLTPAGVFTVLDGAGGTRMTLNSTGLGLGGIAAGLERFVVFSGASKMMSIDTNGTFFADGGTGKGRVTIENSSATNSILSTTTLFGAYNILKTAASQHQWFIGGSTQAMTLDASGRLIINSSTFVTPTLNTNGELNFMATSNTNVRFSYRGTDGVTRTADITLA